MSDATDVVHRIHHSEVAELGEIWRALQATTLPRVGSCSALFNHLPGVPRQIKALGETCHRKPPIDMPFDRRWAIRYDDEWVAHLGRLTYDHDKAQQTPLAQRIKAIFGEQGRLSGFFYYPPGGFKEWHTDFEDPQPDSDKHWRVYLLNTTRDGKSWFQYLDRTGRIRKVPDRNGYLNLFSLTESPPLWHAVYSNTHRWSVGIKLATEVIEALIERRSIA